jgi:hypothetical protein
MRLKDRSFDLDFKIVGGRLGFSIQVTLPFPVTRITIRGMADLIE